MIGERYRQTDHSIPISQIIHQKQIASLKTVEAILKCRSFMFLLCMTTPRNLSSRKGLSAKPDDVRLLSTCASGSAAATESLLLLNISSIIKDILAGSGVLCNSTVSPLPTVRFPKQLYEIVTLLNELLPLKPQLSLPQNGMTST
ncbi:hypothetical protein KP509_05G000700 [Ceratopteris richardii]|uniref:Uncharacterized protein n=1 Tax=Ceratopteris richardii TaxID=49495 RepID=A0A8T2URR1_CERRI|nr:hypothetical protein KP509_05G000700 [Ceratopteris richardii]